MPFVKTVRSHGYVFTVWRENRVCFECDFSGELYQKGKRRYKIDRISDTLFSLDLKAGEEVVLYGDPSFKDFRIGPVSGTENKKTFGFYN